VNIPNVVQLTPTPKIKMDINDTIDLLVSSPQQRAAAFPFEREIRLYQFKVWIYRPKPLDMVNMVGQIIATLYLRHIQAGMPKNLLRSIPNQDPLTTRDYVRLFNNPRYRKLFDAVVGEYGGWENLVYVSSPEAFDDELSRRMETTETVCKMIDYRFRYLDHGGPDPQKANISHSEFYRWSDKQQPLSWKTIRSRWQANRESAPFLYASENYDFAPPPFGRMGFLYSLSAAADERQRIQKFFGFAAYIIDKLDPKGQSTIVIPSHIKRRRPPTKPLTDEELQRMSKYEDRSEREKMRRS
jgi:hypothetical protein